MSYKDEAIPRLRDNRREPFRFPSKSSRLFLRGGRSSLLSLRFPLPVRFTNYNSDNYDGFAVSRQREGRGESALSARS